MPTISSSRVQPLVTPSTALLTKARASPCNADWESFSRVATICPSFCSTLMPAGTGVSTLPFGPCTRTVFPAIVTVTPLGIAIGFFPIRDISDSLSASALSPQLSLAVALLEADSARLMAASLVNLAQQLAAHAFLARLTAGHYAPRSGEDVDPHPAEHAWNLAAAHIDTASGTRHALGFRDGRLVIRAILQVNPDNLVALFF